MNERTAQQESGCWQDSLRLHRRGISLQNNKKRLEDVGMLVLGEIVATK